MPRPAFQKLRVYRLAEEISDELWNLILKWPILAKDTVGKQLVRAVDSIGANIAEGYGRGSAVENRRYIKIARGSLNETIHFLRRAHARQLINSEQVRKLKPLLDELGPKPNAYLASVPTSNQQPTTYNTQRRQPS